ncbi:sterol desaturase family protein [Larkinella sp. C7]|jgi:alkylglycerol monooxygenase|uniref:sterol desaturase family protein n=1 Tax=Larkinella sp. C7 TaxID=2576607 RepID=UPI0027B95E8A|nr:sterol desaturase family protein [Larkinella sp. C7]
MESLGLNWMALAVPFFLFFMGLEYLVSKWQKKDYFRFNNSVANINVGIAERLLDTFTVGAFYFFYDYIHKHYAIFDLKPGVLGWVALFLATDFVWYWYHRLAHEINLFWSAHVVHHQSEDFNYTTSARITVFQALIRTGFWTILPLIGFPAGMISTMLILHGLYPFFIHTRTIGKLGWLEYILVTPSHHRVHHASNPEYLDKNYGDVLIIWDKLFGTFIEEKEDAEELVYGLTKPLESHSFLWQQFHFMMELAETVRRTPGFVPKIKVLFGRPDDIDPEVRDVLEKRYLSRSTVHATSRRFRGYVLGQLIGILSILFVFLLLENHVTVYHQVLISLFILITLVNCGALLEQRQWVFYLEISRFSLLVLMAIPFLHDPLSFSALFIGTLLLWTYFSNLQKRYLRLVYGTVSY